MTLDWLDGDLHTHCERHELAETFVENAAGSLAFLALTNHAQKPILEEQAGMLERMRAARPGIPIFFGLEWNAPVGVHANVIFPPSPREAGDALAFARAHDGRRPGADPSIEAAMATLGALPPDAQPVVFFNHPGAQPEFTPADLDAFHAAAGARIFIGSEALHGHQAWGRRDLDGQLGYPGSRIGGLCDHAYAQGRPFALLAHSDFHVHKQEKRPDYPPGVFNRTRVGVPTGERDARAIFEALRAGRSCAVQGDGLRLTRFSAGEASLGARWPAAKAARVRIELEAAEPLRALDLIGQCAPAQPPRVLRAFGPRPEGAVRLEWPLPAGARGFVRLRAVSRREERPPPGLPAPRLFLSSAILLGPEPDGTSCAGTC